MSMTYKELYEEGVLRLQHAAVAEAKLDARLLLEHVCGTDRNTLLVHGDREVTEEQLQSYVNYIEQRSHRIPLQHLTGTQEFMGLTFAVNEHVLIPRQDTEILVEEVMKELHDGMRILDMCTGSGCILLSLLQYSNDCIGIGADISVQALEMAEKNCAALGLSADFIQSDLFEAVEGRFDIIVSNPPYIRTAVIDTLMEEVQKHEPYIALDGKEDGLFFYRKIIQSAGTYLYRGGRIYFEIGFDQAKGVSELLAQAGYREIQVMKDYAGLDRVVCAVL